MAANSYGWVSQPSRAQGQQPMGRVQGQQQMDAWNKNAFAEQQRILNTQGRDAADAWSRGMEEQQRQYASQVGYGQSRGGSSYQDNYGPGGMYEVRPGGASNRMMSNSPQQGGGQSGYGMAQTREMPQPYTPGAGGSGYQNSPYGSYSSYSGGRAPVQQQGNYTDYGGREFNEGTQGMQQGQRDYQGYRGGNFQAPTSSPMQADWDRQRGFDYMAKEGRQGANSYSDNYLQPKMNYDLQYNDQQFGQFANQRDFDEQRGMNRFNMNLADRGANREDAAFGYGMYSDERNFGENARQFDARLGYDDRALNQQGALTREGYGSQERIASGRNDVDRYGIDTNRYGMDLQDRQATGRLGLDTELGRGDLGLRGQTESRMGRQQNLDESYRRAALSQEERLMRERFQNDLTQSRYSAFGRAQAPNMRMTGGWR